jgi:hypothetical protein
VSDCDDILARALLHDTLDATAAAHVRDCAHCNELEPIVRALRRSLAADVGLAPPAALQACVLRAAAPLLAQHARRISWSGVLRPVAAALVPLPLVLLVDAYLVRTAHDVLQTLLPSALSTYLVFNYGALLALLLTLTYGAIPLLADRQMRLRHEEMYG